MSLIYNKAKLEKFARRLAAKSGWHPKPQNSNPAIQLQLQLRDTMPDDAKVVPIEDLMDASIDDLQDLPPFEVPPVGHYKLNLSLSRKSINDKPCIEAAFMVVETLELKNAEEKPAENGTKFSQLYTMDNEFGQGAFKLFMAPIVPALGLQGKKISEIIAAVQNVTIAATVKQRADKKDKDKIYANVVNPEVA